MDDHDILRCTFVVGTYEDVAAADGGYEAVRGLYDELDLLDTLDAPVIAKKLNGDVKLAQRSEHGVRHRARVAAGWGLAVGLTVVVFPAIGIGAIGWNAIIGAGLSALARHVVEGMKRSDLRDVAERLDASDAALIVAAIGDVADRVETIMEKTADVLAAQSNVDLTALGAELDDVRP